MALILNLFITAIAVKQRVAFRDDEPKRGFAQIKVERNHGCAMTRRSLVDDALDAVNSVNSESSERITRLISRVYDSR